MLKSKIPHGFVIGTNFKSFCNKAARIFLFEHLLYNKVDFGATNFEAAVQLQIEVKRKMLGRSVTIGVKSVEKCPPRADFFELTTPNTYLTLFTLEKYPFKSQNSSI